MFVVNEWARDYFVETLHNNVDGLAIGMSYFRRRGLRDDIIRKFQLGYFSGTARRIGAKKRTQKALKRNILKVQDCVIVQKTEDF